MSVCAELGLTQSEAEERLTDVELYEWMAFFKLRHEEEERGMRKARLEADSRRRR